MCFLDNKKHDIEVFEFGKNEQPIMAEDGKRIKTELVSDVNAEEFLDIMTDLQNSHPSKPPILELMHSSYRSVCPMSLIDNSYSELMVWETFSQEYGGYPFGNSSLGEQPNKLVEAYLSILFSRNEYYRIREEKMKQKIAAGDRKNINASATAGMRR